MNSSDDQNILTHTKKLGNSQFQVFCKSHPQTAHLIFSIQKYLRNFPSFYYQSILMINKGRPLQVIQKRLKKEFDNLLGQKSFYHIIRKALTSRYKCIDKIKRDLTKAERILIIFKKQYINHHNQRNMAYFQYVQQQGYSNIEVDQTIEDSIKLISTIFIDLSRLRDMTLYLVETIHQWKITIQQWLDKCNQYQPVFFIHEQKNVYDTILQDMDFIWQSALSQYIFMEIKNDPFIVRNILQVQQRKQKTVLQKYFVQILYPKSQQIVKRSIKCYQMLTFKYQPQINNLYFEEELLIKNYLSLQKKQQNQQGISQITQDQFEWEDKMKKQKLHPKGWVFGNKLKKPHNQRIKQIVERHQHKITFVKPFNITNFSQKNSLALAYLAEAKGNKQSTKKQGQNNKQKKSFAKIYRSRSTNKIDRIKIETAKPKKANNIQVGYKSQNQQKISQKKISRLYQSLSRLQPVIFEDSREDNQTPRNVQNKKKKIFQNNYFSQSESESIINKQMKSFKNQKKDKQQNINNNNKKEQISKQQSNSEGQNNIKLIQLSTLKTKFNTFKETNVNNIQILKHPKSRIQNQVIMEQKNNHIQEQDCKQLKNIQKQQNFDKISVDQQQQQLNFGDFLTNFRATTTYKIKKKQINNNQLKSSRQIKIKDNEQQLLTIKQLIQMNKLKGFKTQRSRSLLSQKNRKNNIFSVKKKFPIGSKLIKEVDQNNVLQKSKSLEKSFVGYQKQIVRHEKKITFKFDEQFIVLNSKSIPFEIVPNYLRHIFNQIHSTSKKFTLYSYDQILKKLSDPFIHCIIFDVSTQKRGHIGQVILSQNVGINNQKLKYTIQFINIHIFELIVGAILRITQQILYATPCEQVLIPFIEDKLDPVSVHFIDLIQSAFKMKVDNFGKLTILERKRLYYKDSDLHQRLYVFTKKNKRQYEQKISKNMVGNYRSLRFQCKSLLLASNFRMRSKGTAKNVISNYDSTSIGYMYRKILDKILTKFHLRQMKKASLSSNDNDQTVNLIKQNSFLKTSIAALTQYLKQQNIDYSDYVHLTRFQNMSEVLTYLDYKQYSQYFHFNFLEQSRFILNHELFISQIQIDFSIQFMVRSSVDFLLLYNYHNFFLKIVQPTSSLKAKAIILPTTNDQIDLIIIDGRQYQQQTTDKLDLFSYLYIYQQQIKNYKQVQNIKQIVIPTIHKNSKNMNAIKLFDGLFRLFPQREFYSGSYFKCTNLWESYFPSAVIYKPNIDSLVFEYPLIIGFLHKQRNQIVSAYVVRENMSS